VHSGKLCRDDRTKGHVGLLPEAMIHDAAIASDQDAGRRSLPRQPLREMIEDNLPG
jgi:hypothetical protein